MDCKFISISDVTNERGVRMDILGAGKEYAKATGGIFDIFNTIMQTETKQQVTQMYIEGRINKEEYMRRMKNAI